MMCALIYVIVLLYATVPVRCTPIPDQIFPINVPAGQNATNHNSNHIFCVVPAPWFTVMVFYLGNYAAHAATLVTYPGEAPMCIAAAILYALVLPTTGIVRGLNAIFRRSRFPWVGKTDLQTAARAGALCMVVRTEKWRPPRGD